MQRWSWWDLLAGVGSVASIISGLWCLSDKAVSPSGKLLLAGVLIGSLVVVVFSSLKARGSPMARVGREAMIATGRGLIEGAKTEVILFGGDMSWAHDYDEAIRTTAQRGKEVAVLHPKSQATKVLQNAQILQDAGARLIATPVDSGLRAILVDPHDHSDALLYVATRTLRLGGIPAQPGEHGSREHYEYVAKVYGMRRDWPLIKAAAKIYEVLAHGAGRDRK
jgi:hypothetical protein